MEPVYYNLEYLAGGSKHFIVRHSDKGLEVLNNRVMTPEKLKLSFKDGKLRAPGFKYRAYSEAEARKLFSDDISMILYAEGIGINS